MKQLDKGVFYEDAFLGVTLGAVISPHGTAMIDAPLRAEDARIWRSTLFSQRGGSNRMLANLDAHPDRTLGARALDCTILAHQKTAHVFRNRPMVFKGHGIETGAIWETYAEAIGMRWAAPDITFDQSMSLHWGGPEIVLEHHPGPSQGSIWAIVPASKVVFVGDAVVVDQPPFLSNADLEVWLDSLQLLANAYSNYTIVSGRGGQVDVKAVRDQQKFLKKLVSSLDRISKRNAQPEATEKLVSGLLSEITYPPEWHLVYEQRLRYGLYQYFARRYRPSSIIEHNILEEAEQ